MTDASSLSGLALRRAIAEEVAGLQELRDFGHGCLTHTESPNNRPEVPHYEADLNALLAIPAVVERFDRDESYWTMESERIGGEWSYTIETCQIPAGMIGGMDATASSIDGEGTGATAAEAAARAVLQAWRAGK